MKMIDLFETEVQLQEGNVLIQSAREVLQKLQNGTFTLLLAYEKTDPEWGFRLWPLKRADELFPGMFGAYDEEKVILIYTPLPRSKMPEGFINALKYFFHKSGIVPEGKVIPFRPHEPVPF